MTSRNRQAPVRFDILRHRADDMVIPDSRLQQRSRAVGGDSRLSSCAPPHENYC